MNLSTKVKEKKKFKHVFPKTKAELILRELNLKDPIEGTVLPDLSDAKTANSNQQEHQNDEFLVEVARGTMSSIFREIPLCQLGENLSLKSETCKAGAKTQMEWTGELTTWHFQQGFTPKEIIGATDSNSLIKYKVAYNESDMSDLIPSPICRQEFPSLVIDFLEKNVLFNDKKM